MSLGSQRRYIPCCGVGPRLKGLDTRSPIGVEYKLRLAGTSYFFFFLAFFLVVFFFFERQPQVLHIFVSPTLGSLNQNPPTRRTQISDKWWGIHSPSRENRDCEGIKRHPAKTVIQNPLTNRINISVIFIGWGEESKSGNFLSVKIRTLMINLGAKHFCFLPLVFAGTGWIPA